MSDSGVSRLTHFLGTQDDPDAPLGLMTNRVRYGIRLAFASRGAVYSFSTTVLIDALVQVRRSARRSARARIHTRSGVNRPVGRSIERSAPWAERSRT